MKARIVAFVIAGAISHAYAQSLPADFVYLRDVDPSVIQDIRYASSNNFVGHPLAGYDAAECVVRRDVAERLKRIERELAEQNLSLKMLDCYRPARAVATMWAWAHDGRQTRADRRFSPAFAKKDLFHLGYIARRSGHSTGRALDLTLVDLKADNSKTFDPQKDYADCTAPAEARAPEGSVDMGTGYDCTDVKAHTGATTISPEQRRWRQRLVAAMAGQGFVNYFREWWHFSLPGAGGVTYDFPIAPRAR
jgi:zinc D-Ala-D-Ala dipeptidase